MKDHQTLAPICVPRLVEKQARLLPNKVAISTPNRQLTYQELNLRAEKLAIQLLAADVGRDVPVAICIESSIAMIVGALGILKAGGAFLPLDPASPEERLSFILRDSQSRVLLTAASGKNSLTAAVQYVIGLDEEGRATTPSSENERARASFEVAAEDLAYIIYTSGSTGVPKGVQITHGNLSNLVSWHQRSFEVTPKDCASQLAGVGFDAAVWEIWPYLTAGASVHIPCGAVRSNPKELHDWLLSNEITISFIPTVMAERLMALDWPDKAPLRLVLTGGDTLHKNPPEKLPFTLVNNYGPTECTVVATSGIVRAQDATASDQRPSIGTPIANTKIYILDESRNQTPVGTPGEIYIGGAGVARGYLNRPELNAEKFIPDPFTAEPGTCIFKTGDIGCWRPDGQISFHGRVDDQIKIRGYRIELNEIVSTLNQHPALHESAVIAREAGPGDKQILAYCVPSKSLTDSELRDFLRARLPEYMIPSLFVRVERLPLTLNGKVDRDALPKPTKENTIGDEITETASSPIEQMLAGILAPLLGVKRISPEDNFFHLGGHSMLAAQVIARIRDRFDVELSLRSLFDHPTLRGMAAEIERLILAKLESLREGPAQNLSHRQEASL
jgi:amino acid adenylation domain-containing protein